MSTQTIANVSSNAPSTAEVLAITQSNSIVPTTAGTLNLGSPTQPYNAIYANNLVGPDNINTTGVITTTNTTASSSSTTGALIVAGGAGVGGSINAGGSISGTAFNIPAPTNTGASMIIGDIGVGTGVGGIQNAVLAKNGNNFALSQDSSGNTIVNAPGIGGVTNVQVQCNGQQIMLFTENGANTTMPFFADSNADSTGIASTASITISGGLTMLKSQTIGGNITQTATASGVNAGTGWYLGDPGNATYATLQNSALGVNINNGALLQDTSGNTYLNAPTGGVITVTSNGSTLAVAEASQFDVVVPFSASKGIAGRMDGATPSAGQIGELVAGVATTIVCTNAAAVSSGLAVYNLTSAGVWMLYTSVSIPANTTYTDGCILLGVSSASLPTGISTNPGTQVKTYTATGGALPTVVQFAAQYIATAAKALYVFAESTGGTGSYAPTLTLSTTGTGQASFAVRIA